jgi:hypothetical protein
MHQDIPPDRTGEIMVLVRRTSVLVNAARTGMTITYTYVGANEADKWTKKDKDSLAENATNAVCSEKNTRLLLNLGYSMAGLHADKH